MIGQLYSASNPSYKSPSLAKSPIFIQFMDVLCPNSSARVDFPVPGVPEMNKINNYKIIRKDCA